MSNGAMDNGKRIQAVDLITLAMGRLQRVYASPQTSSQHSEAKIALADLKMALDVLA
jgi:predicted aminopeptidase